MNEIEKLNERISQLTELVKSGEETINATKEMLKLAEQERDRLADQQRESKPKFERAISTYYTFGFDYGVCTTYKTDDQDLNSDIQRFKNNCYFHTKERANEVASKINFLLKLERLHDTFCPDYVPDWENRWLSKHYIYQDKSMGNTWIWGKTGIDSDAVQVYFPTEEIAQKVCDILNKERIMDNGYDIWNRNDKNA